jgi:hemerythrin-like metal-binding protein
MRGKNTGDQLDPLLEEMKSEHEQLFQLVDRLRDAIDAEDMKLAKHNLLKLQIFQQSHFEHEASLMEQYAYPHTEDHTRRHNALTDTLHSINRLIHVEGLERLSGALADYLETSLTHITEVDQPFQQFLTRTRIQES